MSVDNGSTLESAKDKTTKCSGRNMVWFLVVCGGLSGVIVHLAIQTYFYLEDQRFVDLFLGEEAFEFPEMTFCRMHLFNLNKLNKLSYQVDENRSISYFDIKARTTAFWNLMNLDQDVDVATLVDRSLRAYAFDYDLYEPVLAEILDCKWNQKRCSFENFIVEKHPKYFYCYTFANFSRKENDDYSHGLQVFLANFRKDYSDQLQNIEDEPKAYMVSLHEPGTRPDFVKQTVYLTDLNINMVDIDKKVFVKLNHPDYPCAEDRDNVTYVVDFTAWETRTFTGRYEDCVIEKTQAYLVKQCGCLDTELYVPEHLAKHPLCHTLDPKYIYFNTLRYPPDRTNPDIDSVKEAYTDGTIQRHRCYENATIYMQENPAVIGLCLPDCVSTVYTFSKQSESVSRYRKYRFKYYTAKKAEFPAFDERDYGTSYPVYGKLFSSKGKATILTEKWAYTLKSFLSDVGGILGLWIGVSFVTLFEIVERFLRQYQKTNQKVKLKREASRKSIAASVSIDATSNG